ncbi:glycoside hydrolase family 3 N-terminal domain-containing protein [Prevotella sp. HCN-7019]|uniref:glycoside hydrolase family 3 N-terminal domain-containing protein n=1 Tax=Prevotella sp. HCN-7019 TaxID=3134668 RepID=UPI0030C08A73
MNFRAFAVHVTVCLSVAVASHAQTYKDPNASIDERVEDLLGRMTLEEKIAQMNMNGMGEYRQLPHGAGVVESPFISVQEIARMSSETKCYARENTRLGIPPIQIGECLHGQLAMGATIFPQAIAQGSTWNPALVERMASVIALEASASGVDQALSPLFDLAREPRYGRTEECYGEDPYLVARMGVAFVEGMQGKAEYTRVHGIAPGKLMCTAKHFAGYSVPAGGINLAPSSLGEREMRTLHLYPFEKVVKDANVCAVMPSYNEVDGMPAHSNRWLLTDVLRGEWGFSGYIFTDYGGLSQLHNFHHVAADASEAAVMGINAGVDLEAARPDAYARLSDLVKAGKVKEEQIDTAVRRILRAKFMAGLFDKPYPDPERLSEVVHRPEHVALALEVAQESAVLLKNDSALLPLDASKLKSLAVIGPNADQVQYGDYTYTRDNRSGVTILQGLRDRLGSRVQINYAKGCNITGSDRSGIAAAVEAASKSDVAVVVLGETSVILSGLGWGVGLGENEPRDPFVSGEGYDLTSLDPPGVQRELLQAVCATGKPVVLVMVHGRPWSIGWEKDHVPAILEAWYPGEQGGNAIAGILFGDVNPSGRLNCSVPRSVGHLPVTYDYKPSARGINREPGTPEKPGRDYVFSSPAPLFAFGHGLSYTTFEYSDLKIDNNASAKTVRVSVNVRNTGSRDGKEVVQLYVNDRVSSVTTPQKMLKGFDKIELKTGEQKTVTFDLPYDELALWNASMQRVVEPGEFSVMIGRSAEDIALSGSFVVSD